MQRWERVVASPAVRARTGLRGSLYRSSDQNLCLDHTKVDTLGLKARPCDKETPHQRLLFQYNAPR